MVFSGSVEDLINLLFIAAGISICGLCFLQITEAVHLGKKVRQYFQIFFLMLGLYIFAHLAEQIMDGLPGSGIRTALYAATFAAVLAAGLMAHMMSMLVLFVARPGKSGKALAIALMAMLVVHTLLLIVGWPNDLIYYLDADNVCHHAPGYFLCNLCPMGMLATDIFLLIRYRQNYERRVRSAFWFFMIAPIIAMVLQSIFHGIQFIIFASVSAAIYTFSVIIQKQNEEYAKQQVESSRIETELTMASSIQTGMLPSIFPPFPERGEFDIYATMDPAKEVGGDFYDFFLVDDDHLCLVIADVSGKGVPAALFMMASKIILANNAMSGKSPAQILTDTNAAICSHNREQMFVTVWLGILELSTGKLTAANAGHEYPVIKRADGGFELFKEEHGFVIGGYEGMRYKEYELRLSPGDKLFVYTDGVPEATNAENELFGTERMLAALNGDASAEPRELLRRMRTAVDAFVKDAEQFDDLTMLCMEYRGENG